MAKEIRTEITINSTPQKIWSVLSNFENYPNWNPFIILIEGNINVGNKILIKIKQSNGFVMTFKPKVITYNINKEIKWLGHFLFKGLFDGEHQFEIIDNGNNTSTFIQSEIFSGILAGIINTDKTKLGFQLMNEKLKEVVENQ